MQDAFSGMRRMTFGMIKDVSPLQNQLQVKLFAGMDD